MEPPRPRHARAEAAAVLEEGYEARVLEPSPPASADPECFADDPVARGETPVTVVSPVETGDVTWWELADGRPRLAAYAREHWLGPVRRLQALPRSFASTRAALHQLAYFVLAPARFRVNGKMGLRYTHRGFGTPFFGADRQVRVDADRLVVQEGEDVEWEPISTVGAACALAGIRYRVRWFEGFGDELPPVDPDAPLDVDREPALALADWFGFSTLCCEELRARAPAADAPSRVQLWPEHFDVAVELGAGAARASFGGSPGDAQHPEPYLYVSPWEKSGLEGPFWNDAAFGGASLAYSDLLAAEDQREAARRFFERGREELRRRGRG